MKPDVGPSGEGCPGPDQPGQGQHRQPEKRRAENEPGLKIECFGADRPGWGRSLRRRRMRRFRLHKGYVLSSEQVDKRKSAPLHQRNPNVILAMRLGTLNLEAGRTGVGV